MMFVIYVNMYFFRRCSKVGLTPIPVTLIQQ
jgi:hypothetical protein